MKFSIMYNLKTLLSSAVLALSVCAYAQDSLHYTRLRIVNSNNDTPLTEIVMTTDQEITLRVQGQRSDNVEWNDVYAKWEDLDSTLNGKLFPSLPGTACQWTFSGHTYAAGRVRVTMGRDSITEPDTIRIEIRPCCGPEMGTFTFLTPVDHVQTGDTVAAVVRVGSYGDFAGWPHCKPRPFWCFPDSSNINILFFDTLAPDSLPASYVITGEGNARLGEWNHTDFPVRECFSQGLDSVKFVFSCSGLHRLFADFDMYLIPRTPIISSASFMVYPGSAVQPGFIRHDRNSLHKENMGIEYFNLRGQKLPLYGMRHVDGIVLERIIESDGKATIRKIIPEIKSR